jgi:uncharacterized membrane protein YuzA (DUF378 family)
MKVFESDITNLVLWIVVALGALNWGLVELLDFDVLTDGLMLSSGLASAGYIIIGAAGAIGIFAIVEEEI